MRIQNPIKHLRWSFKHLRQRKKLHNLKIKIFKQTKQSMTHYYLHLFDDKDTDSNLDETPWCIWKTYRSFSSCLFIFCVVCNTSTTIANLNMICSFMPIKHVMMNVNGGRIRLDTCLGWHIFFKQLHSGITWR